MEDDGHRRRGSAWPLLRLARPCAHRGNQAAAAPTPAPVVTVSQPLRREVDVRAGFLGQFSAIDRVELRAQVGGTLTEIHFKDGQIAAYIKSQQDPRTFGPPKSTVTFSLPDQLMGSPGHRRVYRHREVCRVAHLMV
jgi:hypothetical protein